MTDGPATSRGTASGVDRRTLLRGSAVAAGALALPLGGAFTESAAARPRVTRTIARDLQTPWGIAFLPSGDALVGERDSGDVFRLRAGGGRRRIDTIPVNSQKAQFGEGGLLGLAISPHFRRDRWVYAYLTTNSDNRIVRMRYRDGRLGRRHVVLAGIPMSTHHNGGRLAFGPSGLLFASTGDAEDGSNAQNRASKAGKILRMTRDGRVPRTNPFGNYTFSLGHRNVEGICFDSDGNLWASEFGEHSRDELNRIVRGGNYGWPDVEGGDGSGPYRDPLATFYTEACSPSGVAVAGGRAWLGALAGESLYSVRLDGPHRGRKNRYFAGRFGRIRTVVRAPGGALWITTSNCDGRGAPGPHDDRIIRVGI